MLPLLFLPKSRLDSIRLKENWIDTKESMMMLDEKSLIQLGFPLLLQKKVIEKLEKIKSGSGQGSDVTIT
jgi:hypothetical protein